MKFTSTRAPSDADESIPPTTFEEAVLNGYAPDGGLYVPTQLPEITPKLLQEWYKLSYMELAQSVLRLFLDKEEVTNEEIESICQASYKGFFANDQVVVPVRRLMSRQGSHKKNRTTPPPLSFVSELFHGPTFCFKDLGMRVVIHFMALFQQRRQTKATTILVSTTGDTGPAALQAVRDVQPPGIMSIVVHFPEGQISTFQRNSLTAGLRENDGVVQVVAFQGGGDDMDAPIKSMLQDESISCRGVNSFNIGRPMVQTIHFIWTYLRIVEQLQTEKNDADMPFFPDKVVVVDVVLPTGAMGNIAGAYMAKKMGLPLGKLHAGVNINDITYRAITRGEFHRSPAMHKTLSDAINIQVPYNFERLLYYLTDGNGTLVREWMQQVETTGQLTLQGEWLEKMQTDFGSARITDEEMCQAMRAVRCTFSSPNDDDAGYVVDPHTAVAFATAEKLGLMHLHHHDEDTPANQNASAATATTNRPCVIIATASPCKFEESVTAALGTEGWKSYVASSAYPERARAIMEAKEVVPPIVYESSGASLQETQVVWERRTRQLVADLCHKGI